MKLLIVLMLFGILLVAGCGGQQTNTTAKSSDSGTVKNTPAPEQPKSEPTPTQPSANPEAPKNNSMPGEPAANAKEFSLLVTHSGYTPNTITVSKGDTVRLLVTTAPGQDWHKHGVTLDEYGINQEVRTSDKANPVKIEFVADKAGTFRIYCKTCNDDDGWKGKTGSTHPDIEATLAVN